MDLDGSRSIEMDLDMFRRIRWIWTDLDGFRKNEVGWVGLGRI